MMSVSAFFGTRIAAVPPSLAKAAPPKTTAGGGVLLIECSSRPKKKGTAHHMKTRPKKTQPWDVRRGPTVYPPLPQLPPEWTLVSSAADEVVSEAAPPPPPPKTE